MAEIEAYRTFITEYAPLGYARLYALQGDFYRAQRLLEKALVQGFATWQGFRVHVKEPAQAITRLVEQHSAGGAAEDEGGDRAFSFSQSRKLRSLDEVLALLRSFSPEEQAALVLLHVEEVPPEKVSDWLGTGAEFLGALRAKLDERLASLDLPPAADEDAMAFFLRALRQYRLSPHFTGSVVNQLQVTNLPASGCASVAAWSALVGIPLLFLAGALSTRWEANPRGVQSLFTPFLFALLALLLRRFLLYDAPPALSGLRRVTSWLMLASLLGFFWVLIRGAVLLKGDLQVEVGAFLLVIEEVWLLGTLALLLFTAYPVAVHYLRRLDRKEGRGP